MARKATPISTKIQAAEEKVAKTKAKYDAALAELNDLKKQQDEEKKQEVFEALKASNKSLDEIMDFIKNEEEK